MLLLKKVAAKSKINTQCIFAADLVANLNIRLPIMVAAAQVCFQVIITAQKFL